METSLYFHIPFCRRRCGYCDFNTFAGLNYLIPEYVNSICQEISSVLHTKPDSLKIHTLYFGGGTPSLLSIEHYERILNMVHANAAVNNNAEISIEANPETVTKEYLQGLKSIGFNRISFGMQSASPEDLRILDRAHQFQSVVNAVKWSKQAGFLHINMDLIFNIPGQTRESWQRTLRTALNFNVDHFSVYSLIVEDGTRLKRWIDRGLLAEPDEDLGATMYEDAMDIFGQAEYQQYEISNWSRDEKAQCRHNLQYWRFLPYLGFGAGAHGFYNHTRTENAGGVREYIRAIREKSEAEFPASGAACEIIHLSEWDKIQENLMVSLRMTQEGVNMVEFQHRYQVPLTALFKKQIDRLLSEGLIEIVNKGETLRLTRRGRLFGNRVFMEFIGNEVPKEFAFLDQ